MKPISTAAGISTAILLFTASLAAPSSTPQQQHHGHQHHVKRVSADHPPYLISKWNRIYKNEDTGSVKRDVEDPWASLDDAARAVIRMNAALRPEYSLSADALSHNITKRQDINVLVSDSTTALEIPGLQGTNLLGVSSLDPALRYINMPSEKLPTLPAADTKVGINFAVTVDFKRFFNGSGNLQLTPATQPYLQQMQYKTVISRDGGQGGTIGGVKLFVFDDTQTFSPSGSWTGFVSNSVAQDEGNLGMSGQAPLLADKLGEFANSVGTMRNFIPFTVGEAAYNDARGGLQRFGIWPGSSLIPYGQGSGLLYAPIIYTNAAPGAVLMSYVGMTLVEITVPGAGGAVAARIAPMLVEGPGIEWGAIGGIRKLSFKRWANGNANHGLVYIMGNANGGMFLARVTAPDVANWGAYSFYHASTKSWTSQAPTASQTNDFFMTGEYSTADIFYSPKHRTFIMVYMTPYADNTVYWRYLQAPHAILPNAGYDEVETVTQYPWSTGQLLFKIPYGGNYAYGGGMYRGYFEGEDITEGGGTMLYGWTQPTGQPEPNALTHNTAYVVFT